jgi:hypothetical protein
MRVAHLALEEASDEQAASASVDVGAEKAVQDFHATTNAISGRTIKTKTASAPITPIPREPRDPALLASSMTPL